ncbi:hypothetical protein DZF92_06320 [Clavibacter michiganensis subsp. insidiosus]|nr:hypothetical protein [Clavibacter michiganensis]AWF97229.1 hypothetical protein BEH61_01785 [Clavibacter michiganensis subsp. insidiosus]OQJ58891.1 hypothetical protein B5P21_02490 [Clavibacter michiganensis subsp. insidiosus]RII87592.1 hypothetical protein DZF92_06320 [Clavibacter michiganensis subsp. insidiosus]RIJ44466.1 hypothetical protein DZF93_02685 [Clavibacter michiganensis subsp. insidiosus]RMC85460.1 hypothetical protein CmiCFBP2404_07985 [Clavibacter michiganensis subsp. insidio
MPATRARRVLSALLVAGAIAAFASGCVGDGVACPAIAWANQAEVHLTGSQQAVERVAWVELCDDSSCSRSAEDPRDPGADDRLPLELADEALRSNPDMWTMRLVMSAPGRVTLTAYAADATVLATADADLAWTRVGGTPECGGESVAGPVDLPIPG